MTTAKRITRRQPRRTRGSSAEDRIEWTEKRPQPWEWHPPAQNWETATEMQLGRVTVTPGTLLHVRGEREPMRFIRLVRNLDKLDPSTGRPVEWVDVVSPYGFRSFRPHVLRVWKPPRRRAARPRRADKSAAEQVA